MTCVDLALNGRSAKSFRAEGAWDRALLQRGQFYFIQFGHNDQKPGPRHADPDTLRYRVWHIPARLARHARERVLKISPDWPWKEAFMHCWQRLCALPAPT